MNLIFKNWKKNWILMPGFFETNELQQIKSKIKELKIKNLVYCSFENRFARSGGLAAVTTKILPFLKVVNNIPNVILITPLYTKIVDMTKLKPTNITFMVEFGNRKVAVEIYEYSWNYSLPRAGSLKEYYLKADGFFDSYNRVNDPYIYFADNLLRNDEAIRRNALFYCKAAPHVLQQLGLMNDTVIHLQDWQTAPIALTSKCAMVNGILGSCATVQTLHNSFDSTIPWKELADIIDEKKFQKLMKQNKEGLTALQIGLQCVDAPISVVSDNFAKEFTTDNLQAEHFAPHLQPIFKASGVYGVANGMFVDFAEEFSEKERHTISEVNAIKSEKRKALLKVLAEYHPKERFGELNYQGNSITKLPHHIPIILMSGRLDPFQKGYDVLLKAIERFRQDEVKAILTPLPVKLSDLDIFYDAAKKCNGNLTVFPIRMEKGYHELQIGSTLGVMPSIYEPFGAAIEYMVCGTLNVARATGGLVDQIDHNQCGLLYREITDHYTLKNIKAYSETGNNLQLRDNNLWFHSMVDALYDALKQAIYIYQNRPNDYYTMIIRGFQKARQFNWEMNAQSHFQIYDKVNQGF